MGDEREPEARRMCWEVCRTGAYIDHENGCFGICQGPHACTTWLSYLHRVEPKQEERAG